MGLEAFKSDDVEPGDKYYEYRITGFAVIEYPGTYQDLAHEVRNMFQPNVDYTDEFVGLTVPFEFTSRGHSREQAFEAHKERMASIENTEFDKDFARVVRVGVRDEDMVEKQKDW